MNKTMGATEVVAKILNHLEEMHRKASHIYVRNSSTVDKANTPTKSTQGLQLWHDLYSNWPTKGILHTYSRILEQLSHHYTPTQPQPSSDSVLRLLQSCRS